MSFWLLKSEPDEFSIKDLRQKKTERWDGVRNYQARNFIGQMQPGDLAFFYHSSCKAIGIAGMKHKVTFKHVLKLARIKALALKDERLDDLKLIQKGNRLSVMPIPDAQWQCLNAECEPT